MTTMEPPADISWVTFESIGVDPVGWIRDRWSLFRVDPDLIGCGCCSPDRPCRSMREIRTNIVAENSRKDALLALHDEDVEWLLANGWDGR